LPSAGVLSMHRIASSSRLIHRDNMISGIATSPEQPIPSAKRRPVARGDRGRLGTSGSDRDQVDRSLAWPRAADRAGGPRLWMGWAPRPLVAQRAPSTLVQQIEEWSASWSLRAKHSAIRSGRSTKSKRWFTPPRQARRGSDGKLCSPDAIIAPPLDSMRKYTQIIVSGRFALPGTGVVL